MDTKKLLKVLDLSEEEQMQWLLDNSITDGSLAVSQVSSKIVGRWINIELADLAFRLRDEAVGKDWVGWQIGSARVWNVTHKSDYNPGKFGNRAKPIHWIIAALIAKGE